VSPDDSRLATRARLRWLCAAALFACGAYGAPPAMVVVFGDSLAAGTGLAAAERPKLWLKQAELLSAGRLLLVNEGKAGRSTRALGEFDDMLARHRRIDLLVIALGSNDSGDLSAATVPRAVANLRGMVSAARRRHGRSLPVLIVGPPDMSGAARARPIPEARLRRLEELNQAFAEFAAESGCRFFSLHGVVPESSLAADGMHPDGAGNGAIARALLPDLLAGVGR